jgi:dihydrodipicolinate synthase/N-acetylneuraminate lyase
MAAKIHGVCPVIPTLFLGSEQIDFDSMNGLIDAVIAWGVHGLAIFGIASEFYKLADAERAQLLDFFIKAVRGRVSTIVSVTAHSTLLACRQASEAEEAGADAIMLLPPFFGGPDGASIMRHLQSVLGSVRIPVVLQYAPEETKLSIPAQAFLELAEQAGVGLYVKVESKPAGALISRLTDGGVKVLVGKGGIPFYEALVRGAIGVMPGCSVADRFVKIYDLFRGGEKLRALEEHNRIVPYLCFIDQSTELFLAAEKYFLKRRGMIAEARTRRPDFLLETVHREILDRYIAGFGYG